MLHATGLIAYICSTVPTGKGSTTLGQECVIAYFLHPAYQIITINAIAASSQPAGVRSGIR